MGKIPPPDAFYYYIVLIIYLFYSFLYFIVFILFVLCVHFTERVNCHELLDDYLLYLLPSLVCILVTLYLYMLHVWNKVLTLLFKVSFDSGLKMLV